MQDDGQRPQAGAGSQRAVGSCGYQRVRGGVLLSPQQRRERLPRTPSLRRGLHRDEESQMQDDGQRPQAGAGSQRAVGSCGYQRVRGGVLLSPQQRRERLPLNAQPATRASPGRRVANARRRPAASSRGRLSTGSGKLWIPARAWRCAALTSTAPGEVAPERPACDAGFTGTKSRKCKTTASGLKLGQALNGQWEAVDTSVCVAVGCKCLFACIEVAELIFIQTQTPDCNAINIVTINI